MKNIYYQIHNTLLNVIIFPKMVFLTNNWYVLLLDMIGKVHYHYEICHREGLKFKIRPKTADKAIYKEIFILNEYHKIARDLLKAKVVIDIGAQVGIFSVYAATGNAKSIIYAVEPFFDNYQLLRENIQLNRLQGRIIPLNVAVWSKNKKMTLYLSTNNSGGHSLISKSLEKRTVKTYTLNHIIQKYGIEYIDVLKLDCEGSEYTILDNLSKNTMMKIQSIILEYHDVQRIARLVTKLESHGYRIEFQRGFRIIYATRNK